MRTDLSQTEIDHLQKELRHLYNYYGLPEIIERLGEMVNGARNTFIDADYKAICERDAAILTDAANQIKKPLKP
jgi:hypothetical protein